MQLKDNFNRIHDYVRISLIDKCNLNCIYCNPVNSNKHYFHNSELLTAEDIIRLSIILVKNLEVKKIRFTGGEPLLRKDIIPMLKNISELKKDYPLTLGITTNGTELHEKLEELKASGIDNLNISLDSLREQKFIAITGKNCFHQILAAIHRAEKLHFRKVKVNAVVIKNLNDDELIDFVDYFKDSDIELRFIEFMPFGNNDWEKNGFISADEMKEIIQTKYQLIRSNDENKIAENYFVSGHSLIIGFISSISNHFCDSCNRLRITAAGRIKLCLFSPEGISLKEYLSNPSIPDELIAKIISNTLSKKLEKHPEVEELIKLHHNNMLSIGG
jgi:molybdenum cofactor biosynthesis protein A